jgi:hypothetical protein
LEATVNETVPSPLPLAPDVNVIHENCAGTVAAQAHPSLVITVVLPEPPADPNVCAPGVIEYAQPDAWLTVNV